MSKNELLENNLVNSQRKVCVVGGAGFLGSHVVDYLVRLGMKVHVLDDLSVGKLKFVNPKAVVDVADITDAKVDLVEYFTGMDYVLNYAAMPFIPDCYKDPMRAFEVNTLGALRVIECAHGAKCKRILQVTSAEVYGNTIAGTEASSSINAPLRPVSGYASSKAAIDMLASCRAKEAGIPVVILRQFNCVGERETHPYVIPEIISQLHRAVPNENQEVHIRLGNNSYRDFMYAGDAARMAVELMLKGIPGEAYNLGYENCIQIYQLAKDIARIMEIPYEICIDADEGRKRKNELWYLQSNNREIYHTIKSRMSVPLREALERTIKYFHYNGNKWDWEDV